MLENFERHHSVISDKSFMDKSTLVFTDNYRKDILHSISDGFCDDFHDNMHKAMGL